MSNICSEIGNDALDFVGISATFLLTMLIFFGVRHKKHHWLNYLALISFIPLCLINILFRDGLPIKIFAALMLMTTIIVETVVNRTRKLGQVNLPSAEEG